MSNNDPTNQLFYRFEASIEAQPIGLMPEGLRMALSFEGRVTEGELRGATVAGSDPLLIRSDGVGVLDVNKRIALADVTLYEHVYGYFAPPRHVAAPPLEAMAEPDFAFPDLPFPITGFSVFAAPKGRLFHLNRRIARIDGHSNLASGRLVIEARLVQPGCVDGVRGVAA